MAKRKIIIIFLIITFIATTVYISPLSPNFLLCKFYIKLKLMIKEGIWEHLEKNESKNYYSYNEVMKRKMKLRRKELPKMIDRLKKKPSPFLIREIGLTRCSISIPHLAKVLKNNPDPEIRQSAVVSLGIIGHLSVPYLRKALKDRNVEVRLAAAKSLIELGYKSFPKYIFEEKEAFSSTLDGHLHTDVEYMLNIVRKDPDLRRKLRAAYLLTPASICLCSPWKDDLSHKEECIKVFIKGIKDKDYINQLLSIYGLTRVALYCEDNDKNFVLNILETYLPKEKNENVKSEISDAIKKIRGEFEK